MSDTYSFFKYKIEVEHKPDANNGDGIYICSINELSQSQNSQDLGAAIRTLIQLAKTELIKRRINNEDIPDGNLANKEIIEEIFWTNVILNQFGYAVLPYSTSSDLESLKKLTESIFKNTSDISTLDPQLRIEAEKKILETIIPILRSTRIRARVLKDLYMRDPVLKNIAHIVEQGFYSYYRLEFIASISTLFPLIEGIFLHTQEYDHKTDTLPKDNQTLNHLLKQEAKGSSIASIFVWNEYIRSYSEIYQVFRDTHQKSKDKNFFNRHFIAHGMGHEAYTLATMYKILTFIDLIGNFYDSFSGEDRFFKSKDEDTETRFQQYNTLVQDALSDKGIGGHTLLNEHPNFDWYKIQPK